MSLPRRPPSPLRTATLLVVLVIALAWAVTSAAQGDVLAEARRLVEAQRGAEAVVVLDRVLRKEPRNAEALLLRATARLIEGDAAAGRRDLGKALEIDPSLREGWLTLGALEVAEERWTEALAAFRRAEQLAPTAADNDLNIGAVELLAGDLGAASERFARYLDGPGGDANGFFLVAKNYALAGYEALAVEHLRRSIERDDRARVQAKADPAFAGLKASPRFQALINTMSFRPPLGSHTAERAYPEPYDGGRGPLLRAVLDALQLGSRRFDPRVEVTPEWSLVWGEARIKVSETPDGGGRVELTAPAEAFTAAAWQTFSDDLFRDIAARLAVSAPRTP
jgi:tetratricopeptide (TPR) repeat protein